MRPVVSPAILTDASLSERIATAYRMSRPDATPEQRAQAAQMLVTYANEFSRRVALRKSGRSEGARE